MPETRTRRSAADVETAILDATLELIGERGYAALGVDAVAERAGAARSVLYRRWPDKAHLVAAALDHVQVGLAVPDTGDVREDLRAVLRALADLLAGPLGAACAVLHAERTAKPEVRAAADRVGLGRRRRLTTQVLERAVADGTLERAVLASEAPHAGVALMLFHHLDDDAPVSPELADRILDDVLWPAVVRFAVGS